MQPMTTRSKQLAKVNKIHDQELIYVRSYEYITSMKKRSFGSFYE